MNKIKYITLFIVLALLGAMSSYADIKFNNSYDRFLEADSSRFTNYSDAMDGFTIKAIGHTLYSVKYIEENIEAFRIRDGIYYTISYDPMYAAFPSGLTNDTRITTEKLAENYVTYVPLEMQVYSKDYKISENNKVYTK